MVGILITVVTVLDAYGIMFVIKSIPFLHLPFFDTFLIMILVLDLQYIFFAFFFIMEGKDLINDYSWKY